MHRTDEPLVSVLIPVYNAEKYIVESVMSIINQTVRDIEILILDDASTDSSVENIKTINDSRIRLVQSEANIGIAKQLNKGLSMSTGRYIARMDADDISLSNRLEEQIRFLDSNPDVGIVGTFIETFGNNSEIRKYPTKHDDIHRAVLHGNPIAHPSVMMRRSVVESNGLKYDPEFVPCEDIDFWTRAFSVTRFANLPKVLLKYRVHASNLSVTKQAQARELNVRIRHAFLNLDHKLSIRELDELLNPIQKRNDPSYLLWTIEQRFWTILKCIKPKFGERISKKMVNQIREYYYFSILHGSQKPLVSYLYFGVLKRVYEIRFYIIFHGLKQLIKTVLR